MLIRALAVARPVHTHPRAVYTRLVSIVFVSALFGAPALAQPGRTPPATAGPVEFENPPLAPRPAPETEPYTGTLMVIDGVTAIAAVSALRSENENLALAALASYAIVPSVVHFSRGEGKRGLASLSLRIGLPVVGVFVGAGATSDYPPAGAVLGMLIGGGAAVAIDQFVLARPSGRHTDVGAVSVAPTITPSRGGGAVGVAGSF